MFLRALLAFLALPGLFAFLLPPVITYLDPWRGQMWAGGYPVLVAGALALLWCVRDFYVSGKGTLAPWDPPKRLVVVGLYRHVRNPMYIGVLLLVLGWALVTCSPLVGVYTAVLAVFFHLRVVTHEEPWLSRQFRSQWTEYAAAVPRWMPRVTPWNAVSDTKSQSKK
ncbi:MAG: isoprenylcysteine carboxylmethyltransferase family protein [Desulfomonile tiedjei]|nr:isoprenylcysteine carboxylmethyltransferase family protein [Desulfomonile tiedjei]